MKIHLITFLLIASAANATENAQFTSCEQTTTGQMAITLPPEMKGDDEAIKLAVQHCRLSLKSASVIDSLIKDLDPNAVIPPPNE